MHSLYIFKSTFVNALQSSISLNKERYLNDDIWVDEISPKNSRDLQTGIDLADPLCLDFPERDNLKDIENSIRLHKALHRLTPLQARDPRLWTRLAHVEFWPYMRLRWPIEKHFSNGEKVVRFIETRYFVAQSQSRALLRNGVARLWWTAELSHDEERNNPYELTSVLLSTLDITQQIVERGIGRATTIIKGFLQFLLQHSELLLTGGDRNRNRIRRLAKHLNMYGGVCVLDLLTRGEAIELLEKELSRILCSEEDSSKRDDAI